MKKDIDIVIRGKISDEALKKYYRQLCMTLKEQYGNDLLVELYRNLCDKS